MEPTTAATFAGFTNYVEDCLYGNVSEKYRLFKDDPFRPGSNEKVVIPLCGAGIKSD
nr:hypothetical protein [Virgibacillus necropolis]